MAAASCSSAVDQASHIASKLCAASARLAETQPVPDPALAVASRSSPAQRRTSPARTLTSSGVTVIVSCTPPSSLCTAERHSPSNGYDESMARQTKASRRLKWWMTAKATEQEMNERYRHVAAGQMRSECRAASRGAGGVGRVGGGDRRTPGGDGAGDLPLRVVEPVGRPDAVEGPAE